LILNIIYDADIDGLFPVKKTLGNEIRRKSREVLKGEKKKTDFINIRFTDDNTITAYNKKYLSHNKRTDIITFNYGEEGLIEGDIIISLDTISDNSKRYNVSFEMEIMRVVIHGILHLCGYEDNNRKLKQQMHEREDYYLNN